MAGANTTKQKIKASQMAGKLHDWPRECGECLPADWAVYVKSQAQRAHDDWTPLDLINLGNLAKMQVDLVEQQDVLRNEGHITYGGRSGLVPVENPRCRVVQNLASSINTISRRLGLTSMSVSEKTTRAKRGTMERAATDDQTGDAHERSGATLM